MEGERGHPQSTIFDPMGSGETSTVDRILAGMSAPTATPYPEKPGIGADKLNTRQGPPTFKERNSSKGLRIRGTDGKVRTIKGP